PRSLFLSGGSTGKRDKRNASESFAHLMVEKGIPVVLGWGLPVSDTGATLFAIEIYKNLAIGKAIDYAEKRARQEAEEKYHPWPLLRLFTDGSPLAPIITAGQKLRPVTHRKTTHKFLEDSHVKVLEKGFVGRRRQIQQGLQTLKGFGEKCGLLIHGTAGVGKSCLA
ncbi:MAG: CHAT domain-containing protein, partial [Deltaproteobacteria bacterium]|nr:CHAT domain-containing protein [Deltaproteobacteria bacterium]